MSLPCTFSVIRYVPDVIKGEFVNIGIVVQPELAKDISMDNMPLVQFTRDWSRVRCLDSAADIMLLESLEQDISLRLRTHPQPDDRDNIMNVMEDSFSSCVQISERKGMLAEDLTTELERLMQIHVLPRKRIGARTQGNRADLKRAIRKEFDRAGVWIHMQRRIQAAVYTHPGDPLTIDCGYRSQGGDVSEGICRMFQAIPLQGDMEEAHVLALEAPLLSEGVARLDGLRLELVAIVPPLDPREAGKMARDRHRFGVETMKRQAIEVLTINDLVGPALRAQRELQMLSPAL